MDLISKVITACTVWMGIAVAAPAIWDGSANTDWYKDNAQAYNITTAEELAGLAKLVNNGNTFEGKTIALSDDIFLNDTAGAAGGTWASIARTPWTPIGTESRPFKGEFDGIAGKKNRKIYGLYFNDTTKSNVGLFGYTDGVKISNLDLLVGRVTAANNTGALVGYAISGSITNVHSEVKVIGKNKVGGLVGYSTGSLSRVSVKENVLGQDSVGGLVGYTSLSIAGTTKDSCFFVGNVNGRKYVGGVAGYGSSISRTFVVGNVKGDSSYVGGLAGYAIGVIGSSYHTGGNVTGYGYVGGLVGYTKKIVQSSYHNGGDVFGTEQYVGGVAGYADTIRISYAEGNVQGNSSYVGGLAGYATGIIDSSSHTDGNVTGSNYVGGLVGYTTGSVSGSHSEGDVTGKGNYVGGLIGLSYYAGSTAATIATVDRSYSIGNVKGVNYVGGLVGLDSIYRNASNNNRLERQIKRSYAKGSVEGAQYTGGILGKSNFKCYSSSYTSYIYSTMDSVSHTNGAVDGSTYVGGLAGYTYGSVTGSHSQGDIIGTGSYVGGLIGLSYYAGSTAATITTVDRSYSIGNVKGVNYVGGLVGLDSIYRNASNNNRLERQIKRSYAKGSVEGAQYTGGILGKSNYGYYSSSYTSSIYSTMDSVSHTNGAVDGSAYVGGLAGYTYGSVKGSHSEGNVTGTGNNVGGLAGSGSVSNSYSEGAVSGSGYVGGLTGSGSVDSSYHIGGNVAGTGSYVGGLTGSGSVWNSYSEGNVTGSSYVGGAAGSSSKIRNSYAKASYVKGYDYVGGLSGNASDSIIVSYFEGDSVTGTSYVGGLVGYVSGTVTGSHSKGNVHGQTNIGGLAGYARGSVTGSHSEGNVSGTGNYVGGLLGKLVYTRTTGTAFNALDTVRVKDSYAIGDVKGTYYVGGLVGKDSLHKSLLKSSTNSSTKILYRLISNAYSRGNVEGKLYVGGLIGVQDRASDTAKYATNTYIYTLIDSSCHDNGTIKGDSSYIGGLIGSTYGKVNHSYSEGNVTGLDYVGGVSGSTSDEIKYSYAKATFVKGRNLVGGLAGSVSGSIKGSYFEGDSVTGIYQVGGLAGKAYSAVDSSYSTSNVKGDDNVGGLIGSAYGNVSNSYALGNVDGDGEGAGAGHDNLGGLIGYQYGGSVSKSMALGNVTGTTKLGGLVGRFEGTSISKSYANGNVTGGYYGDPTDEVGNYYIGGLVGYAKGSLSETYASGVVKGIEGDPVFTGCMVGFVNGSLSVKKSYYDKSKCDLGIDGGEESVALTGTPDKTTAEMQTQSTFEDWDFTDTWKIMENTYPFLQIYSNSLTNAVVTTQSLEGINYDGTAKTPLVTSVTLFGETLEYETEYTITYANNVNAGTASINVCGVMPYGGCKVINFEIAGIAVEPTIAEIENMTYTGRALTPEIEVYNGETLLAATDYSIEYKNNVNVGTATVTVTMKGNYSGTASKTFEIEKATPVIVQNPKASDVVVGETLASSELTGGRANVDGEFVWKTPSTKPALENEGYAVIFVPTDTDNYTNSAEIVIPVKVLDMVYVAVHLDNTTIDSVLIVKGSNYTLPSAPDIAGSDFMGFYNGKTLIGKTGDVIAVDENTVIDAVYKVQTFVITFMNGTTVLQSGEVPYGSVPAVPEVALPKNTAQYTYSFAGWDKEVVAVTEAATYNAIIDSSINTYEIVFVDFDGDTLKDSTYAYGALASIIKKPVDPTRTATAQYTYTFAGWNPAIAVVAGDAIYTALYDSTVNVYEVAFAVPNDTLQSLKMNLAYGATPVYEGTPTKEATAQYSYTFKGWSPEIESVSGAATYTAVFDSTIRAYTITFVNGATSLQSDDVAYGVLPEYTGTTPTKEATAQYTYAFKSWTPTIVSVTGEATYAAVFDSIVNKYLITFKNGSEVVQSDSVAYGAIPERPIITLPKNTAQYTYSLSWDKDVVAVTGSATYIATIDSVVNKYDIVFKDYDGTVLKDSIYAYGTLASKIAKPADPARAATPKYAFTFKGWSPSIADVTADAVYTAVYDSTIRTYTITFKNGSETMQSSEVEYGVTPSYKGATPTKTSTKEYTYTFKGWNPAVASVSGAATYTAVFDSTIRKYTVTFMNGNVEMQTISVAYGTTPVYSGNTPTKAATDSCTYKFSGWNSELKPVTGDVTYTAKFEVVKKTFLVHFIYGSNTYQVLKVEYGEIPKYTGNTPAKKDTKTYTYEFVGWSPKLGPVTKETYYTAVFDSSKVTGMQNVRLAGLNMSVNAVSRNIQISAAPIGSAYAILDMQGRILRKGRVDSANFSVATPRAGSYIVRVGSWTQRVDVR